MNTFISSSVAPSLQMISNTTPSERSEKSEEIARVRGQESRWSRSWKVSPASLRSRYHVPVSYLVSFVNLPIVPSAMNIPSPTLTHAEPPLKALLADPLLSELASARAHRRRVLSNVSRSCPSAVSTLSYINVTFIRRACKTWHGTVHA